MGAEAGAEIVDTAVVGTAVVGTDVMGTGAEVVDKGCSDGSFDC